MYVVNKTSVKVGVSIIVAGIVLAGLGLLVKIGYENCMELIRAFERGESGVTPLCPTDGSAPYFLAALPVMSIGIIVLVVGMKDMSLLPQSRHQLD